MKRLARLLLGAVAIVASVPAAADPRAVVELFTSQGCSSCIAADAYMAELAKQDDVIALSFHVDYWDYLGWHDTFGLPEHTRRQRDYAEAQGSRKIYTPQMVVNGMTGLVGSDRRGVDRAISQSRLPVPVRLARIGDTLAIEVGAGPVPGRRPTTIRLVLLSSEAEVEIGRGENAGSTVAYYNVVRAVRPIGMWNGAVVRITLPTNELTGDGVDGYAVLVQEDLAPGAGAILGAALLRDLRS